MFSLELIDKVVDEAVVEILTTQVCVTSSGLDFEDTFLNSQERDIESSTTKIEDQDVAFALSLLVEAVGDGCSRGLIDDTENVQASNKTRIL